MSTNKRTKLQQEIGLGEEEAEAHPAWEMGKDGKVLLQPSPEANEEEEDLVDDEVDFHSAKIRGKEHTQSSVWDPQFLQFSKHLRNNFFKDYDIRRMQKMNRESFYHLLMALVAQVGSYLICRIYFPSYWTLWALPLFVFHIWCIQFGEIVHTRAHWPRLMTGSPYMDSLVDTVAIVLTGTSKETFRRRHIVAHYSDVGNLSRVFSDVWLPFVQFPATFYIFPHKLLTMFLDVELCKRENMSRRQLFVEMIMFYGYLAFMVYEALYLNSYFLSVFHFSTSVVLFGAQVMGAMLAHSGIDKRNSFNSNGLFDYRTAGGLWGLSIWFVDFFGNGGLSNHGIHHAHTQLPLYTINQNLREINKYALENFQDVRYNTILAHGIHKDLLEKIPPPKWYDYIMQFILMSFMLLLAALTIMGLPVPPPAMFEALIVDYRFFFYNSLYEYYERTVVFWESLELLAREKTLVNPNAYFALISQRCSSMRKYIETHPKPTGPNFKECCSREEMRERTCPREVFDFNIMPFVEKAEETDEDN